MTFCANFDISVLNLQRDMSFLLIIEWYIHRVEEPLTIHSNSFKGAEFYDGSDDYGTDGIN